jgi:hypothetical protein
MNTTVIADVDNRTSSVFSFLHLPANSSLIPWDWQELNKKLASHRAKPVKIPHSKIAGMHSADLNVQRVNGLTASRRISTVTQQPDTNTE